jgi:acetolactate synthase-1/2/3 large subunit
MSNGGARVAEVLERRGVRFLFTLCGGHISPILVEAKRRGIRVVDVRHEVTAVFAADAVARLTGIPGVAAVTAGPGVTNTLTAVKNAQLAQSPVVILGGATATLLRGRGSLQDIDQLALMRPHVKSARRLTRVRQLAPALECALGEAAEGVPGPVFLECPVDLLYPEAVVRQWYGVKTGAPARGLAAALQKRYVQFHLGRLFAGADAPAPKRPIPAPPEPLPEPLERAAELVAACERPVLVVGSQALLDPPRVEALAVAVERLGMPVYLAGMARGLLGPSSPLQRRQRRREALREADLVILAGAPCDFRLDYGRAISRSATLIAANRSREDLLGNRRPELGVLAAPDRFLIGLADRAGEPGDRYRAWLELTAERDRERERDIARRAGEAAADGINPLRVCQEIEGALADDSVLVADGGDFVSTASYLVRPRRPLSWLDPGVFGTLGVGAGFALGAKLVRPDADVWILYGDGSVGYSLSEFDSFVRHGIPVIAVVGNDACWSQIAREQIEVLDDDVGTLLAHTAYHDAAAGFGAAGFAADKPEELPERIREAVAASRRGRPVLLNARLARTDFRKGSISI